MIHEVGVELAAQLAKRGCPFQVFDGPDFGPTTTFARERILIEHDPAGDTIFSRHTPKGTIMARAIGVKVSIYAKAPGAGATYWEHIRRAEQVLDLVLIGLYVVAKTRKNLLVFKAGKFLEPEDLKDSPTPGGAKYELTFTFDRGVADRKWDGTGAGTATITGDGTGVSIVNTDTATGATQNGGVTTETA